jgi:glycosyltransferase involved in cell wall biosynthesis
MLPHISVVIPLYNKAPHIKATLDSILKQTLLPEEIIVVDDGSTDGSGDVVESFNNPLIRLIKQTNQGESTARNVGVIAAKGCFVAFLDADDYWHVNHIDTLVRLINAYPDAGLFSTMHEILHGNKVIIPRFAFPIGFIGYVDDFFSRFADGLSLINSTTACVRRDALLSIGGFPVGIKKGPDIITWSRLARSFEMAHTAVITAVYNRDAVNRSVQLRESEPPGSLVYLAQLLSESDDPKEQASVLLLFSRIAFYTCAGMCEGGDYGGVRSILRLVKQMELWTLYAKIALLLPIPSQILNYARRWRHRL